MSQNKTPSNNKKLSVDWLLRGSLTRIGDIFDRFLGRTWNPSSSLATSELIERLKTLLDSEMKDRDAEGKFVPHNLKLKMQWDKFSTDSEGAMKKLEIELLTAVIDHINDNRYHTYAPLKLEVKPDYFIEGVKLFASFDEFSDEETGGVLNVTVTNLKNIVIVPPIEVKPAEKRDIYIAEFVVNEKPRTVELAFLDGERLSVGRTKENTLSIDDTTVSKVHAALLLNSEKQLMVADTGSTNGTFINNKRIAYGKSFEINEGDKLKFGTVEVFITRGPDEVEGEPEFNESRAIEESTETEKMVTDVDNLTKQATEIEDESIDSSTILPTITEKVAEAQSETEGDEEK